LQLANIRFTIKQEYLAKNSREKAVLLGKIKKLETAFIGLSLARKNSRLIIN